MTLLAVILALIIEKLAPSLLRFRRYEWINHFQAWVSDTTKTIDKWNDTYSLAIIVLVPVLLVALIHYELFRAGALLGFLFGVVMLVYTLGPKGIFLFVQQAEELNQHQDSSSLKSIATELINDAIPEDENEICERVKKELLIRNNVAITAIFFWFAVLGPMGALLYRISHILYMKKSDDLGEFNQASEILFAILNWIPTHLTALSYAVTGSFVDALQYWHSHRIENKIQSHLSCAAQENLLIMIGLGSLRLTDKSDSNALPGVLSVIALAKRSVILWLTVLAILTLAGWTG